MMLGIGIQFHLRYGTQIRLAGLRHAWKSGEQMSMAESTRPFEDSLMPVADEDARRQNRAMLPRLHAVKLEPPYDFERPAEGEREQPAPFNAALELVRAASEALERMRAHCREVEAFAQQEIEYHRSQLATADNVIRELDEKTTRQEDTIRQLQSQLNEEFEAREKTQLLLEDLRGVYERAKEQMRQTEGRAAAAEAWLSRLHSEIASAFSELPSAGSDSFAGLRDQARTAVSRG